MTARNGGNEPQPQVGKRPSNPGFLALVGIVWIAAGIYDLLKLKASWKLVPGIFFIGIGLLFLRGAAQTVLRRDQRKSK